MRSTMAIDPGLGGTGYAVFNPNGALTGVGTIRVGRHDPLTYRIRSVSILLRMHLPVSHVPLRVVIECPEFMGGTAKGSAASRGGALVKLAHVTGAIVGGFSMACEVDLVTPGEWKGQLPKEVMRERLERTMPRRDKARMQKESEHAWDAYGLGRWFLERGSP